jgi:hypothetical protein
MNKRAEDRSNPRKPWYRSGWRLLSVAILAVFLFLLYLAMLTPDNEGPWNESQARTPWVEIDRGELRVHDLRDFRYGEDRKPVEKRYLEKSYHLSDLRRTWFGLSHFGPYGLAHSFLSFEFDDGAGGSDYLVLSIEGRPKKGQGYNPLAGLFRRYTRISILSTEEDVIGLRSHLRGERVLLYPVVVESEEGRQNQREFFLRLIAETNSLHREAEFYHTLWNNCLTNLLKHTANLENFSTSDIRVLIPGHTDRLTYALDITPSDLPFEEARKRAEVDPSLADIDDPSFSDSLRCGWYDYAGVTVDACPPQAAE